MKAQQLSRLREELRETEDRLAAERRSLVTREAEVEGRHQKQLAAQAQVLRGQQHEAAEGWARWWQRGRRCGRKPPGPANGPRVGREW